jgi:hypothetical protein
MSDLRLDPVQAYLIPNASRLRHLRITASSNVLEPFLTLPAGSVEVMSSFDITFKLEGDLEYPITVFKVAHSLTGVRLCRNSMGDPTTVDIFAFHLLPWSQLTKLELIHPNFEST